MRFFQHNSSAEPDRALTMQENRENSGSGFLIGSELGVQTAIRFGFSHAFRKTGNTDNSMERMASGKVFPESKPVPVRLRRWAND